ncbi:MAG: glycogen/starch/alpha-glucan phosphorylase [Alphaproteobacteria bacterium]|nr:glycogen/starch/alpha-glucan phosphorylase [Alphaproteobacteria bacterium]MBF0129093.1 glycogen/starch/alpha-glucan phosphorylase [Alphaproteobacteria bacterium]
MQKLSEAAASGGRCVDFNDVESIKEGLKHFMIHVVGADPMYATKENWFYALSFLVRGQLSELYIRSARTQFDRDTKRIYYLSMEFLTGRSLLKQLYDLNILDGIRAALESLGQDIASMEELEFDAALGNGGLGRLAACLLDSMATHGYPGFGYGIRYAFGMFSQRIESGQQVEQPENWLRHGNPWEYPRPEVVYPVRFGGRILNFRDAAGAETCQWVDTDDVIAMAYDVPVSGYASATVSNLRLWTARATRDFDLNYFNQGNYIDAVRSKTSSENLSRVLYPADTTLMGQELRLKQEYFFVSASIQDILQRFKRTHATLDLLPERVSIQLNDTHPALSVAEMMRLLTDIHGYSWDRAWDLTRNTFSYTNHTLLPEALETWPIAMLESVLPRHLEIIYKINHAFLQGVKYSFPGDSGIQRRMSIVDDDSRRIRMAHLAIVGSHKVNGVAALHTDLMCSTIFADFHRMWPEKFVNVTNGVTPRRWLLQSNPGLSKLVTGRIGDAWIKDLSKLKDLESHIGDAAFLDEFVAIKAANKARLAQLIRTNFRVQANPDSMFDVQVKRIHEYKRQLLNILHVITRYNRLRDKNPVAAKPRTVIFAGKSAPGYYMAKLIIRLIHDVAEVVNNDPLVRDMIKVVFLPNYNVSSAEIIMPGCDLSEQISTAGTEASGTGNMKFALNGALTIGTLDGANIEIRDHVGAENFFEFGVTAEEAQDLRMQGYDPWQYYRRNPELTRVLDMIGQGFFSPGEPDRYRPIFDSLLKGGDHYLLLADYASYVSCQERVDTLFENKREWARKAALNVANMGNFSSDRTVHTYAKDVWNVKQITL